MDDNNLWNCLGVFHNGSPEPKSCCPSNANQATGPCGRCGVCGGRSEAVATSTGTLFALPLVSMKLSPEERQTGLVNALKEALRLAGYEPVAPSAAPGAPVLRCVARQMRFKNYTYTWPVVITWGNVELELILNAADGKVLWSRVYQEKYSDQSAMQDSMDKLLNLAVSKIVSRAAEDFTQPDFHRACCGAGPQ